MFTAIETVSFEVALTPFSITTNGITYGGNDSTSAVFAETATNSSGNGMGTWEAQFSGPNAEVVNSTLPRGVAGEFNVHSNFTIVVGEFAAEKQ